MQLGQHQVPPPPGPLPRASLPCSHRRSLMSEVRRTPRMVAVGTLLPPSDSWRHLEHGVCGPVARHRGSSVHSPSRPCTWLPTGGRSVVARLGEGGGSVSRISCGMVTVLSSRLDGGGSAARRLHAGVLMVVVRLAQCGVSTVLRSWWLYLLAPRLDLCVASVVVQVVLGGLGSSGAWAIFFMQNVFS